MKVLCRGISFGYVYNYNPHNKQIDNDKIEQEKKRFLKAIEKCSFGYGLVGRKVNGYLRENLNELRLFITDPQMIEKVLDRISRYQETATNAFAKIIEVIIKSIKNAKQQLKFVEVKQNMMCLLSEDKIDLPSDKPLILVVDNLYPKELVALKENIKGIVIRNSDTFLPIEQLVKQTCIPTAIIPGFKMNDGEYIKLDLKTKIITKIHTKKKEHQVGESLLVKQNDTINKDYAIYLDLFSLNNLDNHVVDIVEGVGLFKTENLLYNEQIYPTKGKQVSIYKKILSRFYPKPVYLKLFDFSKQNTAPFLKESAVHCFCFYDIMHNFYTEQIDALLTANKTYGNLKIVIPMIRENHDFCHILKIIEDYKKTNSKNSSNLSVGVMLETAKAFENINSYKNVDFMIVGTDNLAKELFFCEEDNLFDNKIEVEFLLEPIKVISRFCKRHKIDYFLSGNFIQEEKNFLRLVKSKEKRFILSSYLLPKALEIIGNQAVKK